MPGGGRLGRWQVGETGVVGRVVDGVRAVELGARRAAREGEVVVRDVVAHAVRPAVEARLVDHVELDAPLRAAVRHGRAGVRAVVAEQQPARLRIDRDPERVAEAHRIDLGQRLILRVLGLVEHVARRDRVGGADSRDAARALQRHDPQDLSVRVVRVRRRALRVPGLAARPLVDRRESGRLERVGVVAGRDVEAAVEAEGKRAGGMATLLPLVLPGVDDLLILNLVAHDREAREPVLVRAVRKRRVGQIDVPARHEVGCQLDAQQPVLLARGDGDGSDLDRGLRGGLPDSHLAVALDVEDAPVGGDVELEGILGVVVERDLLEVGGARRRHPVRAAAGAGEVGHRADAAEEVLAEVRLRERLGRVAAAGVERVAAGEVRAPRDWVVVGLAAAVLLVVRRLVEARQHVDVVARTVVVSDVRPGRRRLVVVPLVRARPAGRNRRRGGVCGVLDVDRRRRRGGRMRGEVGAHQVAVPVPAVLGVGGGVDAHVAVARRDVALECGLLRVGEDVARGRQEDDGLVLGEVGVVEGGRVLGGVDREVVRGAERLDRGDALVDRVVAKVGRLGEDEHALEWCGGREPCRQQPSGKYRNEHPQPTPGSPHVRIATYQYCQLSPQTGHTHDPYGYNDRQDAVL